MQIDKHKLTAIVSKLMHPHKGILAADESNSSANKRFQSLGIPQTEQKRREYRQLLLTTPAIEKYVSGVILYDETIRQMTDDGELFRDVLKRLGVLVGIKVDQGLDAVGDTGESKTKGLDGLEERLRDYKEMGAVFTKWRSAFVVGNGLPTDANIRKNLADMAEYVLLVQSFGMVPIVEPEVLLEGEHNIQTAETVTSHVLDILFEELAKKQVYLGGLILKTSMVVAGSRAHIQVSHDMVAEHTSRVLRKHVPPHVGGVVFLSGGQSPDYALHNLHYIAELGPYPWPVTFSFSRALQSEALESWAGDIDNTHRAQDIFIQRLHNNSLARQGKLQHAPGNAHEHDVAGLRGFFWVLVVIVIILLILIS